MKDDKEKALIKKYSNRRLYDMSQKRYITLEELRDRIQAGVEVQVVDSKTGEDLTQLVLIQLILENQKNTASHLFTSEFLHQLIYYQDQSIAEFSQKYLPSIFNAYIEWQEQAQSHFMHWARLGWAANQYSREFFMPGLNFWGSGSPPADLASPSEEAGESVEPTQIEIERLKQKVEELEGRLKKTKKKA